MVDHSTYTNNFMVINVGLSRADPMKHSAVASDVAANGCAVDSAVPVRTRVGALGRMTVAIKEVNSKFAGIRTWIYDNTLPFTDCADGQQKRGKRIVPVAKIPEVLQKLAELKADAFAALDDFMPSYREYYAAFNRADLGKVSDVNLPDPDELYAKYAVRLDPPEPLPVVDIDKLALPVGLATDIANRHSERLAKQLDGAKSAAIQGARDHMATVETQLTDGKRLHASLLENAQRHASLLRGMVEGYDNDPRVLEVADIIENRIASIPSIEHVKDSPTLRDQALRAATTVKKSLDDVARSPAIVLPATSAPVADQVETGDEDSILATLI